MNVKRGSAADVPDRPEPKDLMLFLTCTSRSACPTDQDQLGTNRFEEVPTVD